MDINDLLTSYRGSAKIRRANIKKDAIVLGGEENCKQCLNKILEMGGKPGNIYIYQTLRIITYFILNPKTVYI